MTCTSDKAIDFVACSELSKTHQHLRNETRERLKHLLAKTSTLRDLSCDITPDEIAAEIAAIHGESIKVYVKREPYQELKIIVPKNGTVRDLKAAVRRGFQAYQNRQRIKFQCESIDAHKSTHSNERRPSRQHSHEPLASNISWKYIWRTYYLQCQTTSTVLTDDDKTLSECDVLNKTVLKFVKKIKIDRRTQQIKKSHKFKKN